MKLPSDLTHFVRDAMHAGRSKQDIRTALATANWTDTEIDTALSGWMVQDDTGAVPRPVRSRTARDALFYALLFVVFGMVAGNVLALLYGQINLWMPEPDEARAYWRLAGLRWSMAALIVFTPAFFFLDRADNRATQADAARQHGTMRRWLSALAMLIAVITLMGDALYLIYTWLDGQITARFLVKSATVALMAIVVLAYFREDRELPIKTLPLPAAWVLIALAVLSLGLSLWTIGGPAQGQMEQRDRWRMSDLRTLSQDVAQCSKIDRTDMPETLDPMTCAADPAKLTGYANDVTYRRVADQTFELCIDVEFPPAIRTYRYNTVKDGNSVCIERKTN